MMRYQDLSKFRLNPEDRGRSKAFIFFWSIVQATLWRFSPRPMYGWRRFLLRSFGAVVGDGVLIRQTASINYPWNVAVGDHSWIGDGTVLYALGKIDIGSNVAIAHDVYLCTGSHDYESVGFEQLTAPISIKDECWLTNDCFVGPGVTIGRGVVVGARSTVLADLPEGYICSGSPAKPRRPRVGYSNATA